jgi:hypothetical protein
MMILPLSDIQQDSLSRRIIINQDTTPIKHDSVSHVISGMPKDSLKHKTSIFHPTSFSEYTDTTSVCARNIVADVTFNDFNSFIHRIGYGSYKQFPFIFTEKARQQEIEERTVLIKHLRPGNDLPPQPLHADWMILIILVATLLYSLVSKTSHNLLHGFTRFFLFRGINETVSRDMGGIFHWQSTILNLTSFLIIGLFGYAVVSYYELIPAGLKGIIVWLIVLGIISSAITLRHITCVITGITSGEQEVFTRYLLSIYQSYRFGALFLFVINILMSYTKILPVKDFIETGIFVLGLMYLVRVIRLLIIFINRNISIFYLILYLCALEILPVLIVVKYFTGLV